MKNTAKPLDYNDGLPAILPPSEDGIFQSLLIKPEARAALISAISAFLDRPVKDVKLCSNEPPVERRDGKRPRYDVNCIIDGDKGERCEVEMQASPMDGDSKDNEHENIRWRSVYNLSSLFFGQRGKGSEYSKLVKCYQVTLCNYKVFSRKNKLVERFTYRNLEGDVLCDAATAIFIDLTKSRVLAKKPVGKMTPIEAWAVFLALADKPQYHAVITEIINKMEGISVANEALQAISQSEEERAKYRARLKAQLDYEHDVAANLRMGIEQGIKKERKKQERERKKLEAELAKKNAAIADKEAAIADKEAAIADKEAEIEQLRAKIAELEAKPGSK